MFKGASQPSTLFRPHPVRAGFINQEMEQRVINMK
jgi:hypothetical protein